MNAMKCSKETLEFNGNNQVMHTKKALSTATGTNWALGQCLWLLGQ